LNKNNPFFKNSEKFLFIVFLFFITPITLLPQNKIFSSSEIYLAIKKLNVLGSVLYIAAHPDDENNAILSYMSKEKLVRTGYLSLTRGDGGQNLLGSEKGDLLGVIRTQELLSARRIDGAEQFFSRAIDFGFSKTPQETFNKWDRNLILGDIVNVIREFKPDIIITRFSNTLGGHGHHLASAILAEEAFYAAADPNMFPEQLKELSVWKAKRIVWDSFVPDQNSLPLDIGLFNPVIGKSYNEIAGESRTMHKTQGFGVALSRGTQIVQFNHTAGDTAKTNLFDDIDLSWNRIKSSDNIQILIDELISNYNYDKPENSIKLLTNLYNRLNELKNNYWAFVKKNEVKELIRMCAGLWLEAIVWQPGISPGQNIDIRSMLLNRSDINISLEKIKFTYSKNDTVINKTLTKNIPLQIKYTMLIDKRAPYSQPFWLEKKNNGKIFDLSEMKQTGLAENGPAITGSFYLKIENNVFEFNVPVVYRFTDAVEGEKYKPFVIRPKLSLKVEHQTYVFPDNNFREISIQIESKEKNLTGVLVPAAPEGWIIEPASYNYSLLDAGDVNIFSFKVTPINNALDGELVFKAKSTDEEFTHQIIEIEYPHIKSQTVLIKAKTKLVKLNINVDPRKIGYIMGSGDDVPVALSQLGYNVELLSDHDLDNKDLSNYDVIITGVRAFNVREDLDRQQKRIMEFTENGGTWIVQHNTRFGKQVQQIGPYPFPTAGRDRVAEEDAAIQILIPDHKIFNYPNKITQKDFEGWVQERGVSFADNWGGKLFPLLSCSDAGEPAKLGGLLYARYGKGVFIYTSYSWFRQLPEGVEGAYRMFVNIVSSKQKSK